MEIKIIKNSILHQGIGGKEFIVDEKITELLSNDYVFNEGMIGGNIACYNFIYRRNDFNRYFPYKLYYGKVNGLGYIMAENENIDYDEKEKKEITMEPKELNKKAVYTEVTPEQQARIDTIRLLFSNTYDFIEENCKQSRETSLAITKLEEAQFWAIKGISREEKGE